MKGKIAKIALGVVLVVLLAIYFNGQAQAPKAEAPAALPEAAAAPESAAPAEPEEPLIPPERVILARVGSDDITEADVLQVLQSMGPQGMMMYGNEEGRRAILDELISLRLFALDGARAKLDETAEFREAADKLLMQMLAQAAMREAIKDISATDEEAQKFYEDNKERFTQPERVHARHILVKDDAESADVIAKVQADLKAGASFDAIAKEVSICPSAPQGGDLGEFQRGQMVPEFEAAAFAMNPGEISEPVKTQFGWHIIKVEGRTPAEAVPFDQVKPQILQELENSKISEALRAKTADLRKAYPVELVSGDRSE